MNPMVKTQRRGNILVAVIDNPPVNALSPGVPEALLEVVRQAASNEEIKATVVIGAGKSFIAGADIREFPRIVSGERPPLNLNEVLNEIESSPKPVIMAIRGAALGGGLETAMAGHYRIAAPEARLGQPEVKLGLIPGAGGTQRLPRLIGMAKALEMCALGETISAAEAIECGLIDRIAAGDLLEDALTLAREVSGPRRSRDLITQPADPGEALKLSERRFKGQLAPLKAIEAVKAAVLPFEKGLALERKLFEECLFGPQSKALIHVFFAERAAAKVPRLDTAVEALPVSGAGIVGAGTMGAGIAQTFANAGIPVLLQDIGPDHLERALAAIRQSYEGSMRKKKITQSDIEQRMALIQPVRDYDGFGKVDVVIEAVHESMALKQKIFEEMDDVANPRAILATNTSTLDVDQIASAVRDPERVAGLHFFSPAPVMRLLEIVRGFATSDQTIVSSMALARRLGKLGVVAGNCWGFIGNRMFTKYRREAVRLVEEGATVQQVDSALTSWGVAMGPLAVGDLTGLDVVWMIRQELLRMGTPHVPANTVEDWLYARGRYGQKSRGGWYSYDELRIPSPDAEVEAIVAEYRGAQGIQQQSFEPRDIRERTLFALVNEGARVLEEGIALRSSDIDIVFLNGYGFPAWRGGPMHWAGSFGLEKVLRRIEEFYDLLGPHWKPAPLLVELARRGRTFEQYSGN